MFNFLINTTALWQKDFLDKIAFNISIVIVNFPREKKWFLFDEDYRVQIQFVTKKIDLVIIPTT